MDAYEKEWKFEIYKHRQFKSGAADDGEGPYHKKYVPKDSILSEEQVKANGKRNRKSVKAEENIKGYIY